ncbi:hypothetical protein RHMOL_Rhmol08G0266000 [Rhododendron molle]|uniref:Uncharacterized protein n=1 Tax=Rhododendron molle TaxID=49168 RepID=A0ACC0MT38_RHOML|nr:hypothetical protein RHMOL_Rhmol08G0266000 [Rhododendron molle]
MISKNLFLWKRPRSAEKLRPLLTQKPLWKFAISSVFDRFLSLKRKEREDDEAPQNNKKSGHPIQWKEDAPTRSNPLSLSPSFSPPALPLCSPVGKGRGGQSFSR